MNPITVTTVPSVLGKRYVLEERINGGKFGSVYKGYDPQQPDQLLAIKKPHPFYPQREEAYIRSVVFLNRESSILQRIRHLNVVEYRDHSADEKNPYIVLEYIPETLADKTQNGAVTQALVADLLLQIPELLGLLRQLHLTHGDIKRSNLGYTGNRLIKIFDFGSAISLSQTTMRPCPELRKERLGSHFPPEFREGYLVTPSFDTYTAGKTLEHLLTGRYSPSVEQAAEVFEELHGISMPLSLQNLLLQMTHPDHASRPVPEELKALCHQAVHDLDQEVYFPLTPLSSGSQVDWFGESTV